MKGYFGYDEDQVTRHFRALRSPQVVTVLGPGRKESKLMTAAHLLQILRNPHLWGYKAGIEQAFLTAAEMGDKWEREIDDTYHRTIFLDDLTETGLAGLRSWGYPPAAVEETSPGSYQAWILLPLVADVFPWAIDLDRAARHEYRHALKQDGRRAIERYLISRLREIGGGGDLRAATGRHTGRIAGTWNPAKEEIPARGRRPARPGRPGCLSQLVEDSGTVLDLETAQALIQAAQAWAAANPSRVRRKKWTKDTAAHMPAEIQDQAEEALEDEQEGEYEDIRILDALDVLMMREYAPASGERDPSAEDFFFASRLARAGFSEEDIFLVLSEFGLNDPYDPARHKGDPEEYLRMTAAAAVADQEVAAILAILEHSWDRPEIAKAYAELEAGCTATVPGKRDWYLAGRLSSDGFSKGDIMRVMAEDPMRLIRFRDPASQLERDVSRACAKYPPRKPASPKPARPVTAAPRSNRHAEMARRRREAALAAKA